MLPGKSKWCSELPSHIRGANKTLPARAGFTRRRTSVQSRLSVNTGK